jgi:hypothetical protein
LLVDPIHINNETPLLRTISLQTGTRVKAFTDAVRSRDRRCVITRRVVINADYDDWWGFEAAHIFPLAYEQHWREHNYGRWISTPPNGEEIKGGKINSVQNGLLLDSAIHQGFDMYKFSINPDVCINTLYSLLFIANDYLRTITRLYALFVMDTALLGISSIKDLSMIPKDQLINSSVGTFGRRF